MAQKRSVKLAESAWERRWRARIEGWRLSGQQQRAYCEANGIAVSSFSHWKGKLAKLDQLRAEAVGAAAGGAGDSPSSSAPAAVQWTEVCWPLASSGASGEGGGLELVLRRGWSVRLGPRFEAESLRRLLGVLEELGC